MIVSVVLSLFQEGHMFHQLSLAMFYFSRWCHLTECIESLQDQFSLFIYFSDYTLCRKQMSVGQSHLFWQWPLAIILYTECGERVQDHNWQCELKISLSHCHWSVYSMWSLLTTWLKEKARVKNVLFSIKIHKRVGQKNCHSVIETIVQTLLIHPRTLNYQKKN